MLQRLAQRLRPARRHLLPRASFSSSSSNSTNGDKPHWSGLDAYYVSQRGAGIAGRVISRMPEFFRWYEARAFAARTSDDARSAMFVLAQFPRAARVDLLEFRDAAEQLAHTVYERMYAAAPDDAYLRDVTADDATAARLQEKATRQAQRLGAGARRLVLEQLSVNRVAIAAVDYTSVRLSPAERARRGSDDDEDEWLAIHVQYDVTEHLQLTSAGAAGDGLDDRKSVQTKFAWTFEANVTCPEQLEWWLAAATPFEEKAAVVTAAKVQQADGGDE